MCALRASVALLLAGVLGCSSGATPTPSPAGEPGASTPSIPRVGEPARLCGSPVEVMVLDLVGRAAARCGDPLLSAQYLRVGIGSHDVVMILVDDATATQTDGPVSYRRWLVVDGALTGCEGPPCAALDGLGASAGSSDDDLATLLAMALSFEPGALLVRDAQVEEQAALWPAHAELLRSRPVGLERRGEEVALRAWTARTEFGMTGDYRTLHYGTATLGPHAIRVVQDRVLAETGAHIKTTARRSRQPAEETDPLADLDEP